MRTIEGRRRGLSAVLLVLAMMVAACGDSDSTAPPGGARPVATVSVDPTAVTLVVGDSVRLQAVVKDADGRVLEGRAVQWMSDAPALVAVTPDGYVRAVAAGVANVEAASEGKRSAATITVQPRPPVPVDRVEVAPAALQLFEGESRTLTAIARDAANGVLQGRAMTWASDDTTIVVVNAAGRVTGKRAGTVAVSAMSEGKVGSSAITVLRAPAASLSLDVTALSMEPGDERTLVATARDASGATIPGLAITWGATDTAVAMVTNDGKVTARVVGRTTIMAWVDDVVATATLVVRSAPTSDLMYQRSVPDTNEIHIRSLAAPGLPSTRVNAGAVSHDPSASPTGGRIVFAVHMVGMQGESVDDIFAVDRNGMNMRRLTTMPGWEVQPAWSPTGATIAFMHWDITTGREDIWVMNADGSGQRNLTAGEPAARTRGEPAWSPDGQWLAYSATLDAAAPDRGNIWIMRADGTGKRLLTSSAGRDQYPTWSPDGTRIAFTRGGDLAIVGVATGLVTSMGLAQGPWYPSWSPDGEFIAFAARPANDVFGNFSIYTVRADGSDVRLRVRDGSSTFASVVRPSWIKRQPAALAAGQ